MRMALCGAPKPYRRAARRASSWAAGGFVSRNPYPMGGVFESLHTGTLIYRESFTKYKCGLLVPAVLHLEVSASYMLGVTWLAR